MDGDRRPIRHRPVAGASAAPRDADVAAAIRADYDALPGLSVTAAQAARLWHLDARSCAIVLSRLTADGFLIRTGDGRFRLGIHGDAGRLAPRPH